MGKLVLFIIICFFAYWAWEVYSNRNKKEDNSPQPDYSGSTPSELDNLIKYFDTKIKEIETRSIDEIKRSEDVLKHFKTQLARLKEIKNKNKK